MTSATCCYVDFPKGISRESMHRARGLREGILRIDRQTPARLLVAALAYMSPCTTVARAAAVRRWGGFYERDGCRYAEDAMLWLKFLLNEPVYFTFRPLAAFHREASGLSGNLRGARPIEPFLEHPEEVMQHCPPDLHPLLERFYAIRAAKTAAVLGYWGKWQEARRMFRAFISIWDWRLPLFVPAVLGCTPLAGIAGGIWRALAPRRRPPISE